MRSNLCFMEGENFLVFKNVLAKNLVFSVRAKNPIFCCR